MITKSDFVPDRKWGRNSVVKDIQEFLDSGWDCCEIGLGTYKDAYSCSCCYNTVAKRMKFPVKVCVRDKRVYMTRI